ncbi:hypothetical protein BJ508DRAFT_336544 [Ascobolus immersus RN42]|uniref:Uncharacterized protein n=1 Tax=Ascobolus immersus RN42 TaxID=1160509 RepID=A0A3N4H867_ASCIM|nr:hypothetical protein BJ508DRAFT_336544 [Ascobolus immersus RN42]
MSHLSQFSSNSTWEHLKALKRVYQYLQRVAFTVWTSKRQASTAASSTEAEWMSSALATQEMFLIRHLLLELEYFIDPAHPKPKAPRLHYPNSQHYLNPAADELLPISNRDPLPINPLYNDNQVACIIARNPEHYNMLKHIRNTITT